jgi:hypothetical protein
MVEHVRQVPAIDPATAAGAPFEMVGVVFCRVADTLADVLPRSIMPRSIIARWPLVML